MSLMIMIMMKKSETSLCESTNSHLLFFYWLGFFWLILLLLVCVSVCVLGFRVSGATVVCHGISGTLMMMMMMKKMSDQAEKLGLCVCV